MKISNEILQAFLGEEKAQMILSQPFIVEGSSITILALVLVMLPLMMMDLYVIINIIISIADDKMVKRAYTYISYMKNAMDATHNLKDALKKMCSDYPGNKKEKKAFKEALHHLTHSVPKDYKGALEIIEAFYRVYDVKQFHMLILKGGFYDQRNS